MAIVVGVGGNNDSSYGGGTSSDYTNDQYMNILPAPAERIINIVYPVGSIYMSVNNVNPSTIFGGTWVRWGTGRVPVSLNENDANFNTVEKIGGAASHTHTVAAHNHTLNTHSHTMTHTHTGPSHTHTLASHAHTTGDCILTINQIPAHNHKLASFGYNGESTHNNLWQIGFGRVGLRDNIQTVNVGGSQAHNHGNTGATGTLTTAASGTGNTSGSSVANTGGSGTLTTNNNSQQTSSSSSNLPPYITCYMWKRTA